MSRAPYSAYGMAVLSSVALLGIVLGLWNARLDVPLSYSQGGDLFFYQMVVKGMIDNGGYLENAHLGMPRGQQLYDYPMPDLLHLGVLKLFSLGSDAGTAINLYFFATFPLTAMASLFSLVELGLTPGPAVVASLLFTFLPFHFLRGESHLFLAAYYPIPLIVLVVLWISLATPLLRPAADTRGRFSQRRLNRRGILSLLACLLAASAGFYTAFFSCFLLFVGGLLGSVRRASPRPLLAAMALVGLVFATVVVNASPSLVYHARHGANPETAQRLPLESELYGLKITHLLLPTPEHRLRRLAKLRHEYARAFHSPLENENAGAALGSLAGIGFLFLIGHALLRRPRGEEFALLESFSTLNLALVLLSTIGGFASVFSLFVSPQIRAYNRASVFIAFFACGAVGLLLNALEQRWPREWQRHLRFSILLALIAVVGVFDETSAKRVPAYPANRQAYDSDGDFVARIEASLPPLAMVFQLPHLPFFESPPRHHMEDYDPVRPYLHSRTLRWSYGAMKGREAGAWQEDLARRPLPEMTERISLAGFAGVTVDRFGYGDRGEEVEQGLRALLGGPAVESRDQRFAFYDLRPLGARLHQRLGEDTWAQKRSEVLAVAED